MKLVDSGVRFRVIDDFLSPEDLDELRQLVEEYVFEEVASVVDPEADGSALRSRGIVLRYDTSTAYDGSAIPGAYRSVVQALRAHADMFGESGDVWSSIGFSFWRYAAGSRLGWHNDVASGRRGEFIFFLHPTWHASWGGELLLLDTDPEAVTVTDPTLPPLELVAAKASQAPQSLRAIVPKPNRLVLVKQGTIHCIQRVDRTAGSVLRTTMTGFLSADPALPQCHATDRLDRLVALLDLN